MMKMDRDYFISETTLLPLAHYKMHSVPEHILFTLSTEGKLTGFLTPRQFPAFSEESAAMNVADICDRNVKAVPEGENAYRFARDLVARFPSLHVVPVLDSSDRPVNVLRRWQLFFKDEFFRAIRTADVISIPYPQYAVAIWRAAEIARSVGACAISVLEFGVAQGNGLLACELLAKEIGDIWDIRIDVYGFDGGAGLPETRDYRDCPQCWGQGLFPMDFEDLKGRLLSATLVMGDIASTVREFQKARSARLGKAPMGPSPVGAMLVDVDYYTSTAPVLKMLESKSANFLPVVNMFFDDIGASLQFQGEALAIKEFNARNEMRKISPENESFGEFNFHGRRYGFSKLKACHLFDHPLYTESGFANKIMHDFWR